MPIKPKTSKTAETMQKLCEWPDCKDYGEYQAPKSRHALYDYHYFCLNHVREYNSKWNFYAGMSEKDINHLNRLDAVWERPTWSFTGRGFFHHLQQAKDAFYRTFSDDERHQRHKTHSSVSAEIESALKLFDIQMPFDLKTLKKRYKILVKLHHPDQHQGNKEMEEKLKQINQTFTFLKKFIKAQ